MSAVISCIVYIPSCAVVRAMCLAPWLQNYGNLQMSHFKGGAICKVHRENRHRKLINALQQKLAPEKGSLPILLNQVLLKIQVFLENLLENAQTRRRRNSRKARERKGSATYSFLRLVNGQFYSFIFDY